MHFRRKMNVFVALSRVDGCDAPHRLAENSLRVCFSMGSKMYGSLKHYSDVVGSKKMRIHSGLQHILIEHTSALRTTYMVFCKKMKYFGGQSLSGSRRVYRKWG